MTRRCVPSSSVAALLTLACGLAAAEPRYPDPGGDWSADVLPPMNGNPADFAPRRAGAEVGAAIRMDVAVPGIYRLTQPALTGLGLDPADLVGDRLRLFCRTREIAVEVSTPDVFGPDDVLQFYGAGHPGAWSTTNVYWLGFGPGGLRADGIDASTNAGGTVVNTHVDRVRYAPDTRYNPFYRPWDDSIDHWFAAFLTNTGNTVTSVLTDERVPAGTAALTAVFYGITAETAYPDHITRIRVNGSVITNAPYDDQSRAVVSAVFDASLLSDGATAISFRQTASSGDLAYLVEYDLDFTRNLRMRNGQLVFWGRDGTNRYEVSGLATNEGVLVLDITDPAVPVRLLNGSMSGSPNAFTLRFRHVTAAPHRYLVAEPWRTASPAGLHRVFFRDLSGAGQQADYLLVCPYPLRAGGYALLKHRAAGGLRVAVAPPRDIYNEFSYGIVDAAAIKQFFGYAFHHWPGPPPRYACLVGEGTYDPRNHLGGLPPVTIPTPYGSAGFVWAASDGWFTTVNGADTLPDLALGRIPVSSTGDLDRVVAKITAFEDADPPRSAVLVADNVDGELDFKTATRDTIVPPLTAAGYAISEQYLDDLSASTIRTAIRNKVNNGRHLLTFFGHGSDDSWCQEDVWNTGNVAQLVNTQPTLVTVFSCNVGAFDDPAASCLGEAFMTHTAGAASCVAPTALSTQLYAEKLAAGFFAEFTNTTTRLGDAMNAAFLNLWQFNPNVSELRTYVILGDPALEKY